MNKLSSYTFFLLLFTALLAGCHGNSEKTSSKPETTIDYNAVQIPAFDADSAYRYVADQVAFGFRTPGSQGQRKCAAYLTSQMRRWCDTVIVQDFPAILWDGRLWADHDPDEANHRKPFDGANDGASGVGVLMELARAISSQPLSVPVDIIFFDVEDQGVPEWADKYENDSWCKGSQYWSKNPHVPFYSATYGILLDMVGTQQPRYTKEEVSRQYASGILNKIWNIAAAIGYGDIFVNKDTDPILDDHYYVNRLAGIPMVDIVQNTPGTSFFQHWHTLGDNMEHVDKNSLRATGIVLLKTLYADYGAK